MCINVQKMKSVSLSIVELKFIYHGHDKTSLWDSSEAKSTSFVHIVLQIVKFSLSHIEA